jgi:iron complex transport system substrate-binding protein
MRIASLVPSATEMLFELGLGDSVVAVTHECDWPAQAASLPQLTRSVIPEGLSAPEIDRTVRDTVARGAPLYELDRERLEELDPELIVTQAVCEVCAVSYDDVVAVAATLRSRPGVISLDPLQLADVLADVRRLGEATGTGPAAERLLERAATRLEAVRSAVAGAPRPRVLALEWLEPPFVAGHWVPEMIAIAGGDDALGRPASRSRTASWEELERAGADVVVAMPCGYDAERSALEAQAYERELSRLGANLIVAIDAAAYFSRPGPRLVTGVELLAHALHPELVAKPDLPGPGLVTLHDSAGGGTRTPTGISPPAPKAGASTGSATPAQSNRPNSRSVARMQERF